MLEVENLYVSYGGIEVLHGVELRVGSGEIAAIVGANGAGKTTLLRSLSGLLPLDSGQITFLGQTISGLRPAEVVGLGLSQVPEGRHIFPTLTVSDNLKMGAYLRRKEPKGKISRDLDFVFELFPRLRERRKQKGGTLSGGEQQMLAIGRSLMARPKLMMLDEPSLGLAPLLVREIFSIIKRINEEQKTTILLVEQNANLTLTVADYAYIMENGRIVLEGNPSDLKENADVREFYLGLTDVGQRKSYRDVKHYKRRKRWLS